MTQRSEPPADVDLVISAGSVVTMDAERRIIRKGAVAIAKGDIVAVGSAGGVHAAFRGRRHIDAPQGVLTPGLIDAHNHPIDYLIKGLCDDLPQIRRLRERVLPYESQLTEEGAYAASAASFVEMIRHGTTCFADGAGPRSGAVARAALAAGIRGVVAHKGADLSGPFGGSPLDPQEILAQADRTVEEFNGAANGRIRACYDLDFPPMASDQLAEAVRDRARARGVGILGHFIGMRPPGSEARPPRNGDLERYARLGLLGPNLLLAHVGWIPDPDIALLADTGTSVVHCPSSSLLGGNGWVTHGVIPELISAGVKVALGTDAAIISRSLDMVRVMYLAACAHKDARRDPEIMGAHKAFEMATIDGACALNWGDRIGSLEVGKAADLTLFDTAGPQWMPDRLGNPVADLVYGSSGTDARTVVIDGQLIMDDGRFVRTDLDELAVSVASAAASALDRLGIRPAPRWPVM